MTLVTLIFNVFLGRCGGATTLLVALISSILVF